jgi:hypothetical protein
MSTISARRQCAAWFNTPLQHGTGIVHVADGQIWGRDSSRPTTVTVKWMRIAASLGSGAQRGYSFGPHRFNGKWYLSASPSKKSIQRLKTKVRRLLVPSNVDPWDEVRDKLNRSLLGWPAETILS